MRGMLGGTPLRSPRMKGAATSRAASAIPV